MSEKRAKFRVTVDAPKTFLKRWFNSASGCWIWTGSVNDKGYGRFWITGKHVKAHVFSWEFFVGPIPKGMELDHLCRNRNCVNPEHLEPVTHAENVRRGISPTAINSRRVRCANGHLLGGRNLYIYKGHRHCKACRASRLRFYRREGTMPSLTRRERGDAR